MNLEHNRRNIREHCNTQLNLTYSYILPYLEHEGSHTLLSWINLKKENYSQFCRALNKENHKNIAN